MISTLVSSVRSFLSILARWSRSLVRAKRFLLMISSSTLSLEIMEDFHVGSAIVLSMMFRRMPSVLEMSACSSLYAGQVTPWVTISRRILFCSCWCFFIFFLRSSNSSREVE